MFNGLVINPAYAGAEGALSATFIQRSQWTNIDNAPTTQTLTAHSLIHNKNSGIGLTLVNDKIGAHKNLSALANYAYHIRTGENAYLSMGIQAGLQRVRSDYTSLNGAANDPSLYNADVSQVFFDFGAGIYFRSSKFHAGLSAPQLLPESLSLSDSISISLNRTNLFLFSKYKIALNESVELEPSFLLKYLVDLPLSYDLNLSMIYRKVLSMGISYRKKESVDFMLRAQVTPQLQLGYAYDHTIGDVSLLSSASHELMVQYLFRFAQDKVSSPR